MRSLAAPWTRANETRADRGVPEVMRASVGLGMLVLAAASGDALACSCAPPPPMSTEQLRAEGVKVLLGRVLSRVTTGGADINRGRLIYRIAIEDSINLPASGTIGVSTAPNEALCGVVLEVEQSHVLFIGGEAPDYTMSLCANLRRTGSDDAARRYWDKIISSGTGLE